VKCLAFALILAAGTAPQLPLKVESGTASFNAGTTVRGVEVSGKSNALTAHVEIVRADAELTLRRVDAVLPARSLTTGMKVRDDHMRKYIFQDASGQEPDLRFSSEGGACATAGNMFECPVVGEFQMRGMSHPFTMALRVKQMSGTAYHAEGSGVIKLSDYGIEPPSQFGVKMLDEVKIHIDFKTNGEGK
jgi:polyisoprenoid-binding protein YceI